MENKSIKECIELLEGVKVLSVGVKKVLADGKLSVADLPAAVSLLEQHKVLVDAVVGAQEIPAEVKDLSLEEIQALAAKALEIVAVVKGA